MRSGHSNFVIFGKCFTILLIDAILFYFYFQEANKRNNNFLPPPWAIVAMLVLGFNEFMSLLRCMSTLLI